MAKKATIKYLCVDTNIFIQCCLLEIDGDNLEVLNKLHDLLDKNKVKLLIPEVIKLEFYKVLKNKIDSLTNLIGVHKKNINTDNFNKKIKEDLIKKLEECAEERRQISKKVTTEIELIFDHVNTIQVGLELTPQIFVDAYKLSLSGDKPYKKEAGLDNLFQQDCLIIESLRTFFRSLSDYEFYFCSQNKTDFAEKETKDMEALGVHKQIKNGFQHISYYENLGKLLNKEFKSKISKETIQKLEDGKIAEAMDATTNTPSDNFNYPLYSDSGLGSGDQLSDLAS